ncbi:hypothetical protein E2C01_055836 [Portunus trituberculatus]|uniref:Uncharacterized protein n=1 Tax=Portunus trituberculatus TaxID=210409 RepID=A0A5B7GNJ0_PORTR|nr:hypothetical protein [Portunus trituberculatus]
MSRMNMETRHGTEGGYKHGLSSLWPLKIVVYECLLKI